MKAGTTKSLGQKNQFDKFYTKSSTIQECIKFLNFNEFDCIIEPSAGSGNFLQFLPHFFAYDIEPEGNNIIKADWLTLDKKQFNQYKNILVIGNPPFGVQNNLAIKFFNVSASFCNVIAFILPLSFKKDSIQNKLDLHFHLEQEYILPKKSFILNGADYDVPCVFQIWRKQDVLRKKRKMKTTTDLFEFVDKNTADFRIQRVGGNAGKASFNLDYSAQSNYFIKNKTKYTNEELVKIINSLKFPSIEFSVGPKSLSKGELIAVLEDALNS